MHSTSRLSSLVKAHQHLPFVRDVELTKLVDEHAELRESVCLYTQKILSADSNKNLTLSILQDMMWSILVILWNNHLLSDYQIMPAILNAVSDKSELSRLVSELLVKEKQLKNALDMVASLQTRSVYTPEVAARETINFDASSVTDSPLPVHLVDTFTITNSPLLVDTPTEFVNETVFLSQSSSTVEKIVYTTSTQSTYSRPITSDTQTLFMFPKFESRASVPPLSEPIDHWQFDHEIEEKEIELVLFTDDKHVQTNLVLCDFAKTEKISIQNPETKLQIELFLEIDVLKYLEKLQNICSDLVCIESSVAVLSLVKTDWVSISQSSHSGEVDHKVTLEPLAKSVEMPIEPQLAKAIIKKEFPADLSLERKQVREIDSHSLQLDVLSTKATTSDHLIVKQVDQLEQVENYFDDRDSKLKLTSSLSFIFEVDYADSSTQTKEDLRNLRFDGRSHEQFVKETDEHYQLCPGEHYKLCRSVFERLYRDAFERLERHEAAAALARQLDTEEYLAKHAPSEIWEID